MKICIPNEIPALKIVEVRLRAFAEEEGISNDDLRALLVVVDELAANAITYGFEEEESGQHQIRFELEAEDDLLTLEMADDGRPFDPLALPPPDIDAPLEGRVLGGLGIHIVRQLMDSVDYQYEDGWNVLRMTRRRRQD